MKSLLIFRHAKSSWKDADLDDHDRPLNKRGRSDAPRMARWLAARGLQPDLIVSSTAERTRQTVERAVAAAGFECPVRWTRDLYLATPADCIEVLRVAPAGCDRVMVVGHNPGLEGLLRGLTGVAAALPTAAVAHVILGADDWLHLRLDGSAQLAGLWLPRELPDHFP